MKCSERCGADFCRIVVFHKRESSEKGLEESTGEQVAIIMLCKTQNLIVSLKKTSVSGKILVAGGSRYLVVRTNEMRF